MKAIIKASSIWAYTDDNKEVKKLVDEIKRAGLPVWTNKTDDPDCPREIEIVTEITELYDLNKLVKSFGAKIVYNIRVDGVIYIEKYDTFRE